MTNSILRLPDVKLRTGLSRSTIYNSIKSGNFPKHVSLGSRAIGWHSEDIDNWIATRISNVSVTRKSEGAKRVFRTGGLVRK